MVPHAGDDDSVGTVGRVLVLGGRGMLGSMVCHVLRESGCDVLATQRQNRTRPGYCDARDSVWAIGKALQRYSPLDAVVNCIGITRVDVSSAASIEEALLVNGAFPWKIGIAAQECGMRVIHISTDGVFQGRARPYTEGSACDAGDVYGLSKRAGETVLPQVLSVRCSIVGPDQGGRGLLEWFLRHPDASEVPGYTNHVWNGVTTRQLAYFVLRLIQTGAFDRLRARTPVVHFSPNRALSKYCLLTQINRAYRRNIHVRPVSAPAPVRRVLSSRFAHLSLAPVRKTSVAVALRELVRCTPFHKGTLG